MMGETSASWHMGPEEGLERERLKMQEGYGKTHGSICALEHKYW